MENHSKHVTLTREELYKQVWATPMRKLALTYGLSDVGLKKLCTRHQIPTPPVGYWAKKEFGKHVRQPPLPPPVEGTSGTITLAHDPDPKPKAVRPESYPVTDPDLLERYLHERDPEHQIQVPDQLRNIHPIIQRTREATDGSRCVDHTGLTRSGYQSAEECVPVAVSPGSFTRALRLLNCLFRELEKRGHQVVVRPKMPGYSSERSRVKCLIFGEEFGFSLREKVRMVQLTEKEQRASHFSSKIRYDPKGEFELRLTGQHGYAASTWTDSKTQRIENRLNDVVVGMLVAVEKARRWREHQQREEEARRRREQERLEQERLKQIAKARVEQFEAQAGLWQKAEILRAYVEVVREEALRRFGEIEPNGDLGRWLEWAEAHIRVIDPLMAADLPSLEELPIKAAR
jgi:hypothetical protein